MCIRDRVKTASKIGKFGKILGVGGVLLGVGLQIWEDKQENKAERQLVSYRSDIRNTFAEAANVIDLRFDEDTQCWINENISPKISEIDNQIQAIEDEFQIKNREFQILHSLLEQTRNLIKEIQMAS